MARNFGENTNKKKFQIIGILVLCLMFIAIMSSMTVAWFMDESETSNGEPNITLIGDLELDVTTNFKFNNLALAPDTIYTTDQGGNDIATYLKTSANHDIDGAYARVKYETTRKLVGTTTEIDNLDILSLYFVDNLTTSTTYDNSSKNKWVYNNDDEYYYYLGGIYNKNIMFNRGYRTSNTMTNEVADANVSITITVDAIQRQYGASDAVWTTSPQVFKDMVAVESKTTTLPQNITVSVSIDGVQSNVTMKTNSTLTKALTQAGITSITDSNSCGWYTDEDFTNPISGDTIVTTELKELYTKSSTDSKINITTNSEGKKTVSKVSIGITGEIVIPNDVAVIGANAFEYSNISGLVIPNSVERIERLAIGDTKLVSLHIPKSVTYINEYIGSPSTLSKITVDPENPAYSDGNGNCIIEKSTKSVILGCKNTTIPSNASLVNNINRYAFRYNTAVTSLNIPANITTIGLGFLTNNVTNITVDAGNTIFHSANNCLIRTATKELYYAKDPSTIPADGSVTKIQSTSLKTGQTITLHINKYIASVAGDMCPQSLIQNITIDSDNATFRVENGYLIEKSTNALVMMCKSSGQIPEGITSIKSSCFFDYVSMSANLIFPSTLTKIERYAFSYVGRSGTLNIYLPSTVTNIASYAFDASCKINVYTDVASYSAHPSGWSTSMISSGTNVTMKYGYSLAQFKSAVGA